MLLGRLIYTPFVRVPCLFSSGPSFGVQLPSLDLAPILPAMWYVVFFLSVGSPDSSFISFRSIPRF